MITAYYRPFRYHGFVVFVIPNGYNEFGNRRLAFLAKPGYHVFYIPNRLERRRMVYAKLFKGKGDGLWTVCTLNDRIWSSVSPRFKMKRDANRWATENGYKVGN